MPMLYLFLILIVLEDDVEDPSSTSGRYWCGTWCCPTLWCEMIDGHLLQVNLRWYAFDPDDAILAMILQPQESKLDVLEATTQAHLLSQWCSWCAVSKNSDCEELIACSWISSSGCQMKMASEPQVQNLGHPPSLNLRSSGCQGWWADPKVGLRDDEDLNSEQDVDAEIFEGWPYQMFDGRPHDANADSAAKTGGPSGRCFEVLVGGAWVGCSAGRVEHDLVEVDVEG